MSYCLQNRCVLLTLISNGLKLSSSLILICLLSVTTVNQFYVKWKSFQKKICGLIQFFVLFCSFFPRIYGIVENEKHRCVLCKGNMFLNTHFSLYKHIHFQFVKLPFHVKTFKISKMGIYFLGDFFIELNKIPSGFYIMPVSFFSLLPPFYSKFSTFEITSSYSLE